RDPLSARRPQPARARRRKASSAPDRCRSEHPRRRSLMALKDRLEARRQGSDGAAGDGQLTVLEGMRGAPPVAPQQPGALDDQAQKSTRTPLAFAAVKGAIHEMLVERHADEIDITDRVGVKSRIASLAGECARAASLPLKRSCCG